MKQGDKVWLFLSGMQEIVAGECISATKLSGKTRVTIGYTAPSGAIIRIGGNILGHDCFPTRESLCEHYKKIFE